MAGSEHANNPWMNKGDQSSMVRLSSHNTLMVKSAVDRAESERAGYSDVLSQSLQSNSSDGKLKFAERAVSAEGTAILSAIIANPLDVVKVIRLKV